MTRAPWFRRLAAEPLPTLPKPQTTATLPATITSVARLIPCTRLWLHGAHGSSLFCVAVQPDDRLRPTEQPFQLGGVPLPRGLGQRQPAARTNRLRRPPINHDQGFQLSDLIKLPVFNFTKYSGCWGNRHGTPVSGSEY